MHMPYQSYQYGGFIIRISRISILELVRMRYSDFTSLDVHLASYSESTVEVVELARGRMLVEKGVLERYPYLGTAALIVQLYTTVDLSRPFTRRIVDNRHNLHVKRHGTLELVTWQSHSRQQIVESQPLIHSGLTRVTGSRTSVPRLVYLTIQLYRR